MEEFIIQGKEAFKLRKFEKAFEWLSKAIGLLESEKAGQWMNAEDIAELYLLRGSALLAQNEREAYENPDIFNQILDDYEQTLELDENQIEAYGLRGRLYLNCQFTSYKEEARKDFQEVLSRDPMHLETLNAMGQLFYEQGEYPKAIYYLNLVLKEAPTVESWELRALSHLRSLPPNYTAAIQDFGKAKDLQPDREEFYLWRAQGFQELGLIEDAIKEYDQLLDKNPNNSSFWVDRGTLSMQIDAGQAMEDFSTAIELAGDPLGYNNRAFLHRQQGDYVAALTDAQKALEADPNASITYATIAEIYADMGEEEPFYQYFQLALEHYYEDAVDARSEPGFQKFAHEDRFLALLDDFKTQHKSKGNTDEK
ncbi:MAG: tetratricopeptide repeat protein [Bacteroidota bacterium]